MLSIAFFVGVELMQWTAALAPLLVTTPETTEKNGVFSTLLHSVVTAESSAAWLYWRGSMTKDNYTLKIWEGGTFRREISGLSYGEAITMAEERAISGNAITVRVYAPSGKQILHYGPYINVR